ncbi:MAG: ATP-dependent RecD-like DNA helicase [Pseudomonadota bacterium]|nr:ATP-dependent RecD-like DNA helicase [Pseudomonadota bacterium]
MVDSLTLEGSCSKIIFQNAENGYTVFQLKLENKQIHTCVGSSPNIKVGQHLKVTGTVSETKYGPQIQCEVISPILPKDKIGIIRYLSSGIIPGIGEGFAKKLVAFAGIELFTVLDNDPERLYSIKGIGKKRLDLLIKNWQDYRSAHEVMMFLQRFSVGPRRAMKIYQTYQDQTLTILETNPYQIYQDIAGIGFKIADQIAKSMGIKPDEDVRITAGIQYILEQASASGHCFLQLDKVNEQLAKLLEIEPPKSLHPFTNNPGFETTPDGRLYLKPLYTAERKIEKQLNVLSASPSIFSHHAVHFPNWLNSVEGISLSASQKQALLTVLNSKIGIITGGPGVGKTTITKALLHIARLAKFDIVLCAPTGRAAKKLSSCTNYPAKTIHRLLKMDPVDRKFQHNQKNPLKADLIIIDEASMIDTFLAQHILHAIDPLANIIIIGDVDQLPSVGPGAFLKDMITLFPQQTAHLTEIFRQARDSHIIQNAHLVNKGKMLIPNEQERLSDFYFIPESDPDRVIEKVQFLIQNRIPKRFHLDPLTDIQILAPMHRGSLGTQNLNQVIQSILNPQKRQELQRFKVGDKVIQTKNNYDKDVFNGDVGFIKDIDLDLKELYVDFGEVVATYTSTELDELQLAYAISIHKSQGSEYPAVIIPLAMQHFTLLERNLLYTAITRGKQLVILIGEMKAVAMAIRNQKSLKRNSYLQLDA